MKTIPSSRSSFLQSQSIQTIPVQEIMNPDLKRDDVLCVFLIFLYVKNLRQTHRGTSWKLDAEQRSQISQFFSSASSLSRPGTGHKNIYLDSESLKLAPELPDIFSSWEESAFVPIFPRSQLPGAGRKPAASNSVNANAISALQTISDLPARILPLAVVEERETYKENMILVDGWRKFNGTTCFRAKLTFLFTEALQSSPSAPSSYLASEEEEIDQLIQWEMSSPDTDPSPVRILKTLEAKMGS